MADARRVECGPLSSVVLQANNQRGCGAPNKTAKPSTTNNSVCGHHEDHRAGHRCECIAEAVRQSLTLSQGYKSYAVRTVITGWFVYPSGAIGTFTHNRQGRELQLDHRTQRIRKVQHPRLDMFRPRYHQPGRCARAELAGRRNPKLRTS
jgi:hypothetical protein